MKDMKITKARLKQIIKEELEVTLTNEEATEMFGEDVREQLEEEPLDEGLEALAADLDPQRIAMMVEALLQIGYNFAAPMLAAFLARIGYEAGATIWQGPLKRKDKNWLVNFIYDEVTGYKDHKGPAPKAPKGPPPGTVIPMGKDINRDDISEQEEAPAAQPKLAGDVARAGTKLGKASGIEAALSSINTRPEFEQMLMQFIQMVAKEKLKPQDVKVGLRNVTKQVLQSK